MPTKKKRILAPSKGPAFWKEEIVRYEQSGLSQQKFCQQQGSALSTLNTWFRHARSGRGSSKFIPLQVTVPK